MSCHLLLPIITALANRQEGDRAPVSYGRFCMLIHHHSTVCIINPNRRSAQQSKTYQTEANNTNTTNNMIIRQAIVTMIAIASSPTHKIVVDAFVPTSILTPRVLSTPSTDVQSISSTSSNINSRLSISTAAKQRHTKQSTALQMSSSQDFDQQQYTDASWSAISTLPQCADYYSATSVDAPMLLAILLNPTKYQASENASTAKQVVTKLLNDANVNIDKLKDDVEEYLQKQPTVSGDTSTQKSMGRTLGEVLEAGRGVRDGLKVRF